jgi:hypothetical protein
MTNQPEETIVHRELDVDAENPAVEVAEVVADLEGKSSSDLSSMYDCVDGVLDHLFSTPPSPEAQMVIEFTYESYRITVEQNGSAQFVKTE